MQRMQSRLYLDDHWRHGRPMKKPHAKNKLTLNIETIRHMKQLTLQDLRHVEGGSGTCSGGQGGVCTSTALEVLCAR